MHFIFFIICPYGCGLLVYELVLSYFSGKCKMHLSSFRFCRLFLTILTNFFYSKVVYWSRFQLSSGFCRIISSCSLIKKFCGSVGSIELMIFIAQGPIKIIFSVCFVE